MIGWFKQNIQILKNRKMFDSNPFMYKNKQLSKQSTFQTTFSLFMIQSI